MAKGILLLSLMSIADYKDNATMIGNVVAPTTWLNGLNDCKHTPDFTMASAEDIEDRKKIDIDFASELEKYLPMWTYAFEVTLKSTVTDCCVALVDAQCRCKRRGFRNLVIPEIHPQTLNSFAQRNYTNVPVWGDIKNENKFLNESADLSVRCLVLDENGKLRKDICTEHHRTLCIRDTTHAVFQYVDQSKIPLYTKSTTERQTSSRFSNTESTTVTASIGTGTGVSIGVVIIVCISAVMLIILAVVLTILIMKKRSIIQETHQRGVEYVAEQTNGHTPANNEAGHVNESADEKHDEGHSSRSPNTQGSAYESLGERQNDEHSYGSPNTQRSPYESLGERHDEEHGYGTPNTQRIAYESLGERHSQKHSYGTPALATSGVYQPLEEEMVDTHTTTKIANYSRKSEYDSLGDKTTEIHPNQTINVEAYEWVE